MDSGFDWALPYLKVGHKIRRNSWPKDQYIRLKRGILWWGVHNKFSKEDRDWDEYELTLEDILANDWGFI
jgi:hypothetical protein